MALYKSYNVIPYSYINGLRIKNDETTPDDLLRIEAGITVDSTLTFPVEVTDEIVINTQVVGLNGIDTGVVAASEVYAVYLVWDTLSSSPVGAVISLSLQEPYLPYGYNVFKLIGHVHIDADGDIVKGYWTAGNTGNRQFFYAYNIGGITLADTAVETEFSLYPYCPKVNHTPVTMYIAVAGDAGTALELLPNALGVANSFTYASSITAEDVQITSQASMMSVLNSGVPSLAYRFDGPAGPNNAILNVSSYEFFV